MTKRYPVFSLLGARYNFHQVAYLFNSAEVLVSNLTLAKFLFLAVLLNLANEFCRLSNRCIFL